ncbi:hypothetical protein ACTPEF_25135 [Clostridioides difficile]
MSVATLKNPITWGNEKVEVIFFISLENDTVLLKFITSLQTTK